MNRIQSRAVRVTLAVLSVLAVAASVAAAADEAPRRVAGEMVAWTDGSGRLALAVDVADAGGRTDGHVDEVYLLAPETPGTFRVAARRMRGTAEWSKDDGYVAVFGRDGRERWTMSTNGRSGAAAWFHGVELVRVAGRFGAAPDGVDLSDVAGVLFAGASDEAGDAVAPLTAGECQSGGAGAISCSRKCTNIGPFAGSTQCDVSCGSGYYACCSCEGGLVARCTCKLAPKQGESGPKPADPKIPTPCFPSCSI